MEWKIQQQMSSQSQDSKIKANFTERLSHSSVFGWCLKEEDQERARGTIHLISPGKQNYKPDSIQLIRHVREVCPSVFPPSKQLRVCGLQRNSLTLALFIHTRIVKQTRLFYKDHHVWGVSPCSIIAGVYGQCLAQKHNSGNLPSLDQKEILAKMTRFIIMVY